MAEHAEVEKQVFKRLKQWEKAANERDFDTLKNIYTKDGAALPNKRNAANGREEIKQTFMTVFPEIYHKIIFEKHTYFEKLTDDTVYANSDATCYDAEDKAVAKSKDTCLWKKKEDGEWYLQRCMFNESPFAETSK